MGDLSPKGQLNLSPPISAAICLVLALSVLRTLWAGTWVGSICWKRLFGIDLDTLGSEYWEKYSGCIGTFFAQNLLSGFPPHGFRTRSFLGSIARILSPGSISVDLLNIFWLLSLLALLSLFAVAWIRMVGFARALKSPWSFTLILAIFILGPGFSIPVETMGDPMQLCIVIVGSVAFLCEAWGRIGQQCRLIVMSTALVFCFLIHEASLLLLGPLVIFWLRKYCDGWRRAGVFYVLVCGFYLIVSAHLKSMHGELDLSTISSSYSAYNWRFPDQVLVYRGQDSLSLAFSQSLLRNPLSACSKLLNAWLWPVIFLALTALALSESRRRVLAQSLFFSFVFSLPLYLVAFDWGRFAVLQLVVVVIISSSLATYQVNQVDHGPFRSEAAVPAVPTLFEEVLLLLLGIAFLIATFVFWPINDHMTFAGIQPHRVVGARGFALSWFCALFAGPLISSGINSR